jgi:hypothetical protein
MESSTGAARFMAELKTTNVFIRQSLYERAKKREDERKTSERKMHSLPLLSFSFPGKNLLPFFSPAVSLFFSARVLRFLHSHSQALFPRESLSSLCIDRSGPA